MKPATLRVIAGEAKGRRLRMVPGPGTRPISDRVKESLFSILAGDVVGVRFLDLFAGTGSVGIEALSRGAAHTTFVESGARALETLHHNLTTTHFEARAQVIRGDVFRVLSGYAHPGYGIIYVAPPQSIGLWQRTLHALDARPEWLGAGGVIVAQMHPKEREALPLAHFEIEQERRYGTTLLMFFAAKAAMDGG